MTLYPCCCHCPANHDDVPLDCHSLPCHRCEAVIHHGDCLDVMQAMPEASIDAIVTDPPYGLGFMGKAWDDLPPGEEWARECLRVLKPGGHLLAFGGTRTWHRLAVAIEDAGFEVRDSIAWMHGQGFPKNKAGLKPAHEPIVVARKKPDAARTGLLQIDAARIEGEPWKTKAAETGIRSLMIHKGAENATSRADIMFREKQERSGHPAGRWPANVVLDESQAAVLGESRFFYVAKASKRERPEVDGTAHPTVKPLALMRWLVRLVTPPGGIVLDPFAGSGATIEAALLEGMNPIGIEREAEYLPLIHARIARAATRDAELFDGGAA